MSKSTKNDVTYQDSGEDKLLAFFTENPGANEQIVRDFWIKNRHDWPIEYHLSAQRETLLDWYDFGKDSSCLEIGAGCGACTGALLRKCKTVIANELTKKRADIIRLRYKNYSNLTVEDGTLEHFKSNSTFDYITVIGVLEYAGRFYAGKEDEYIDPYIQFLQKTRSFMHTKSKLLIAIENRMGLKYLSGSSEDHTLGLYDGINNYPNYRGIRTFSKRELEMLLNDAGFSHIKFFYPFPDYKLPTAVFSEKGLQAHLNLPTSDFANSTLHGGEIRIETINEPIFTDTLRNEGKADLFSNSFLVEASL